MHVAIIGNGVAGITAARYIRKFSDHDITVISAESDYFFSRTALMYVYMGHMTFKDIQPYENWFWEKNRINLVRDYVQKIDVEKKLLTLSNNRPVPYHKLIIATGSKFNKFGWPGQDLRGVQGMITKQDLQLMEQNTRDIERAVVVGGGLIGIEMSEMLRSRHIPVSLLVREQYYWNNVLPEVEAKMVSDHIREHHVDLRLGTELKEILPDENDKARAVVTQDGEEIECQFVGLTAGVHPNIDVVKSSEGIEYDRGVLINEYLETNVEGIYACGDCAQFREPLPGRRPVEQVWYTGKIQGMTVARSIHTERTKYQPGIWFNSAKFMDIEYQVYGDVPTRPEDHQKSLLWLHPGGKKSIRIVYDANENNKVIGFNLMGVRFRHKVCDRWLREGRDLEYVLENLRAASFDPEFYDQHDRDILSEFEKQTGKKIRQKRKRKLWPVIFGN